MPGGDINWPFPCLDTSASSPHIFGYLDIFLKFQISFTMSAAPWAFRISQAVGLTGAAWLSGQSVPRFIARQVLVSFKTPNEV